MAAGADVRQDVYGWLMKTSRRRAQDRRILDLLEIEAFQELHVQWQRLGYPFAALTPSLATAIGSSGDRPQALAELMGIIVNGGIRQRTQLLEGLHFAADTPYEVQYRRKPDAGERVLNAEVVRVARSALIDVAENGTARSLQSYLKRADGSRHLVGGKTGTGDHRFEVIGSGGHVIESRVVNRVATFMFLLDDRYYGTITAFVAGADAAHYKFTSGLPVRLLGSLMPTLTPLLDRDRPAAGVDAAPAVAGMPARPRVEVPAELPVGEVEAQVPDNGSTGTEPQPGL
jgi:Penicillin binding protein transpeptidase domain